nr:hypothetical protein P5630_02845 [Bacillus subtilis]
MSQTTASITTAQWRQKKRDQFVSKGVSNGNRSLAVKGEGYELYDLDGTGDLLILQAPSAR